MSDNFKPKTDNRVTDFPYPRHPFMRKGQPLTELEQEAMGHERRYENLINALHKYKIRKDPVRKEDVKREIKELKKKLDVLWDKIADESRKAFNNEI